MDDCTITIFDKDGLYVKYKVSEAVYDRDDTYIAANNGIVARRQTVRGLSGVSAVRTGTDPVPEDVFCMKDRTAPRSKCTGNLSAIGRGNRDAYNGIVDSCPNTAAGRLNATCGRPLTKLNIPARYPD
jgi:hypothetical protein